MVTEIISLVVITYLFLSYVLLRIPQLLHTTREPSFKAVVIGHRGGAGEFLENTMDAFLSCAAMGCDLIELDCQLTKDSQVVVSHDNNLSRGTGHDVHICDLNFNELPKYLPDLELPFGFGEVFKAKSGTSRSIPLLRSVFEALPNVPINIDVKEDNVDLIYKISQLIEEFNRKEITVWGSFSDEVNMKCHKCNPRIKTFFPIRRVLKLLASYHMGLLPFLPIEDDFFEIPLVKNFFRMPNVIEYLKIWISRVPGCLRFGASDETIIQIIIKVSTYLLMSPKLFAHLKKRGIPVYLWVCNTENDFDEIFSTGGVGIVSDYPSRLLSHLEKHPEIERGTLSSSKSVNASQ